MLTTDNYPLCTRSCPLPRCSQFTKCRQFALGQGFGQYQVYASVQVAATVGLPWSGHPLAAHAEASPRLGMGWYPEHYRAIQGGHSYFAAERGRIYVHGDFFIKVISSPLESRVGQDADDQVKVSRLAP